MTGIQPSDLMARVILPTLARVGLDPDPSPAAALLCRTAAQESGCGHFLVQQGGPAVGLWEMEPFTHDDLWVTFLNVHGRDALAGAISRLRIPGIPGSTQMDGNLYYACAMARVRYYRAPGTIPPASDVAAQGAYWKTYYNAGGKGTVAEFVANAKAFGI